MTATSSTTTRLHIAPFNLELLPLVLPASVRPLATDISFHCIPTFPENNYGYVTLPTMEADKIKKKLNGSILKGRKFKVEAARPQKRQRNDDDDQNVASSDKPTSDKKSKKRKAEDNVLDGYELPSDRKVKRGWTESGNDKAERRKKEKKQKGKDEKKMKSQQKSKYTEKAECLFRTKVPPNRASPVDDKSKKQSKKRNKSSQDSVVHEFSKTITHPSFLRSEDGNTALTSTYEEGKGWIDDTGNVKEQPSDRIRKEQYRPGQVAGHKEKPSKVKAAVEAEKPRGEKSKGKNTKVNEEPESIDESEDWTSSSGSSSSEDDTTDSESDENVSSSSSEESEVDSDQEEQQLPLDSFPEKKQKSSDEPKATAEKEGLSKTDHGQQPKDPDILEVLFKRPAGERDADLEPAAQFSFFGQGGEDSDEDEEDGGETQETQTPLTPFTNRDLQDRGLRSAAPTPDTTQVLKTINWNSPEHSALGADISVYTDSPVARSETGSKEDSAFTKWFWENRGDNNRAWKRRRREAAKEQRQRENRRKGMKGKS